jgi:hypothetical protein
MKLTEFIHIERHEAKVGMSCEVTPGHVSKHYVKIWFERVGIADGKPQTARIELNACPACFAQFALDVSQIGRDVSTVH